MEELASSPPKKSRLTFWIGMFLLGCLVSSAFLNLLLFLALGANSSEARAGGFTPQLVDGEKTEKDFIAIVPVQGLIMEPPSQGEARGSYGQMVKLLNQLRKEKNLKGVLLVVDSPGGGVTTSDRMFEELARFKKETNLPVVAHFEDVAASGGYYVAMAADHIIAHRTTVTGSIGVISRFYNLRELLDHVGVEVNTIKSLNFEGRESFKDIGSPYRPMRPEEKRLMQTLITQMWERFVEVVCEGRKDRLTRKQVEQLADGRVFSGSEALKLKLVDQVGYSPDAYSEIRKRAGSPKARIVRFLPQKGLAELFRSQTQSLQVPKLELPGSRLLYLWEAY